jgi:hypothetical protein
MASARYSSTPAGWTLQSSRCHLLLAGHSALLGSLGLLLYQADAKAMPYCIELIIARLHLPQPSLDLWFTLSCKVRRNNGIFRGLVNADVSVLLWQLC